MHYNGIQFPVWGFLMKTVKFAACIFLAAFTLLLVGCLPEYSTVVDEIKSEPAETPAVTETAVEVDELSEDPTAAPAKPTEAATEAPATATPEPTAEPTATPLVDPNPDYPYYLYVEKGSFTITIYGKDENFNYTKVVRQYRIGHGDTKTPVGIFKLSSTRHRWYTFRLGGSVQYATAYWGNLYIHSPLYGSENPWNLWPKYYNGEYGIGTAHTGGCLRMVTEAAKFIYENCPVGTTLEIVNGSPRGTTSPAVPPMVKYGYDPTDVEANG